MVDFRQSLRKGLVAHEQANNEKAEIRSIIESLEESVGEVTEGKVGIKIITESPSFSSTAAQIAAAAAGAVLDIEPIRWLVAYNLKGESTILKKIARWEVSVSGYPCTIRYHRERIDAYDRASLEAGLSELLEFPETARIIHELQYSTR